MGVIVHVGMPVSVFCAARVYCGVNKHMNDAQLIMRLYHYTVSEVKARGSLDALPAWVGAGVRLTSIVHVTTVHTQRYVPVTV